MAFLACPRCPAVAFEHALRIDFSLPDDRIIIMPQWHSASNVEHQVQNPLLGTLIDHTTSWMLYLQELLLYYTVLVARPRDFLAARSLDPSARGNPCEAEGERSFVAGLV